MLSWCAYCVLQSRVCLLLDRDDVDASLLLNATVHRAANNYFLRHCLRSASSSMPSVSRRETLQAGAQLHIRAPARLLTLTSISSERRAYLLRPRCAAQQHISRRRKEISAP